MPQLYNSLFKQGFLFVIIGPTASGKTSLSEQLALDLGSAEIINADVPQMYSNFAIGTAKPDLEETATKKHLFDLYDQPQETNVIAFRRQVEKCVADCYARGKVPIIVGGSHFYIKNLFFKLRSVSKRFPFNISGIDKSIDTSSLYETLQKIDPDRGRKIHPHDRYRIEKALILWFESGEKPSCFAPQYDPIRKSLVISLSPERELIKKRIQQRASIMIKEGWIKEVEEILDTPWENFLKKKGFIGYPEIIAYLKKEQFDSIDELAEKIITQTVNYAKRQFAFIKMMKREIESNEADNQQEVHFFDYHNLYKSDNAFTLNKIYDEAISISERNE